MKRPPHMLCDRILNSHVVIYRRKFSIDGFEVRSLKQVDRCKMRVGSLKMARALTREC
jgi:hypothetical protein